jgi:hypothetical protein
MSHISTLVAGIVIGVVLHWLYIYNAETAVFYQEETRACYYQSELHTWEHTIQFRKLVDL